MNAIKNFAKITVLSAVLVFNASCSEPTPPKKKPALKPADEGPTLKWERIDQATNGNGGYDSGTMGEWAVFRLKVPGGWLVRIISDSNTGRTSGGMGSGAGITFVPDPHHEWAPYSFQ